MGLRQLPWSKPVKVERVQEEPKLEEKTGLLLLNRGSKMLQNLGGAFSEIRWSIRM